jgi:transcriptional regulator with XRE-family HTH domain
MSRGTGPPNLIDWASICQWNDHHPLGGHLTGITDSCYKAAMKSEHLKQARLQRGYSQEQAATLLGVTQAYFSMLETGRRKPSTRLARNLMRTYGLPPTVLPVSDGLKNVTPDSLAQELASLGYPGFAHLRRRGLRKVNPAQYLLSALTQRDVEARVAEGLPWVVARYPDMDFDWLVPQARMKNLQNRLGFAVTLARLAGGNDSLRQPEQALAESKLAKEDSFCKDLSEPERRWLRKHSSEQARQWNLLSDLQPDMLRYV